MTPLGGAGGVQDDARVLSSLPRIKLGDYSESVAAVVPRSGYAIKPREMPDVCDCAIDCGGHSSWCRWNGDTTVSCVRARETGGFAVRMGSHRARLVAQRPHGV